MYVCMYVSQRPRSSCSYVLAGRAQTVECKGASPAQAFAQSPANHVDEFYSWTSWDVTTLQYIAVSCVSVDHIVL